MGGRPVGHLQSVMKLSSGLPKTNPASGREEDLNLRPQDYKSRVLKSCYTSDFLLVMVIPFFKNVASPVRSINRSIIYKNYRIEILLEILRERKYEKRINLLGWLFEGSIIETQEEAHV